MSQPTNLLPRSALLAIGTLVLGTLVAVTAVQVTGVGAIRVADAPPVAVREFNFEDRADGSIEVLDARTHRRVDLIEPGTNGFLRGTMRGLARERKRRGFGPEQPFQLVGRADGRLTLEDPATGRHIDLGSFGPTNAAVFARIMASGTAPHAPG